MKNIMIMFRLTSSLLCVVFVFLSLRDFSAYAHNGSQIHGNKLMAARQNIVPSEKELISDATTTVRLRGRKMTMNEASRGKKLEKEVNGEEKEATYFARKYNENGEMQHLNDDKYKLNSDANNNPPKKLNVASLLVFSADYLGPKVHPPHNYESYD